MSQTAKVLDFKDLDTTDCTVDRFGAIFAAGLDGTLIDVREYPEYAAGHIPGACLVPLGRLRDRAKHLDSEKPVYLVCRTGRRSAEAAQTLLDLGFSRVRNIIGGMIAWELIGGPIQREPRPVWSMDRQVRFISGALVLASVLLSVSVSPLFIGLAAFVGAGLAFAAATDTCAMGSLLLWMPWNRRAAANESSFQGSVEGKESC